MSTVLPLVSNETITKLKNKSLHNEALNYIKSRIVHDWSPTKNHGKPRPKKDEIKIQFGMSGSGRLEPLICFGSDIDESIVLEVCQHLCTSTASPIRWHRKDDTPSLFEQLEIRGFDIKTFKMSVRKSTPNGKRYSRPRPRDGEIRSQWGKIGSEPPEMLSVWGNGCREHVRLFHLYFDNSYYNGGTRVFEDSLTDKLEAGGFHIPSLRVSCELAKKPDAQKD